MQNGVIYFKCRIALYMYVFIYVYRLIYIYIYMYVCLYVSMYIYICVCIYICTLDITLLLFMHACVQNLCMHRRGDAIPAGP